MDTKRNRAALAKMSEEQRVALEHIRARRSTPEHKAEMETVRDQVETEIPPATTTDPGLSPLLVQLRGAREQHNVSLTEMHERSHIDRATISKLETGKIANPTWSTLQGYANALGLRITTQLEPVDTKRLPWDVEIFTEQDPHIDVPVDLAGPLYEHLTAQGVNCTEPVKAIGSDLQPYAVIHIHPSTNRDHLHNIMRRWKRAVRDAIRAMTMEED